MSYAIVIVAAGRGERLGKPEPKAFVAVAGKTILEHSLINIPADFEQLVIVVPQGYQAQAEEIAANLDLSAEFVVGGATRQDSVAAGLQRVKSDFVLIHDSARCFTPVAVFERVLAALRAGNQAVLPVVEVSDSIKKISGNKVLENLDRNQLAAAQTPQGFVTEVLASAITNSVNSYTDDAAAVLAIGKQVCTVKGDPRSLKITNPHDIADSNLVGIGVDSHAFSDSGELVLGTVRIPELPALEGHSDGDALSHAIVDSLLSAAGLGDIGSIFGVDDDKYEGASGDIFLKATCELLAANGFSIVNVAVQIIADRPKIAPIRNQLETSLTELIQAPVTVIATTTDGLGFLADGRGVAAVSTALIRTHG